MRRRDRRIESWEEIVSILRRGEVCFLSMVDDGKPYVVPLNYGYEENALYFHTAPAGRKIDILRRNPGVCFSILDRCELVKGEKACSWSSNYCSVTGTGKARILTSREEVENGLEILMGHYSEEEFDFTGMKLDNIVIIRVEIGTLTGKSSDAGTRGSGDAEKSR